MQYRVPCVYIMSNRRLGTLYVGVTSDLPKRAWQHRNDVLPGFVREHGLHLLVWFELHDSMVSAIGREKTIKKWRRAWKIELIEQCNGGWRDLYPDICA